MHLILFLFYTAPTTYPHSWFSRKRTHWSGNWYLPVASGNKSSLPLNTVQNSHGCYLSPLPFLCRQISVSLLSTMLMVALVPEGPCVHVVCFCGFSFFFFHLASRFNRSAVVVDSITPHTTIIPSSPPPPTHPPATSIIPWVSFTIFRCCDVNCSNIT